MQKAHQSLLARWMVADTMASLSALGISATRPKSSSASLPASGPSVTRRRLPGCGSPWKKPARVQES